MSTNVKRATRKGLLPDYHSILAIIFNIIHMFFFKNFFCSFLFSLQHGGQIRCSSCVTSRESGLLLNLYRSIIDTNECLQNLPCHPNARCNNTEGSYMCICHTGYDGDGLTCNGK